VLKNSHKIVRSKPVLGTRRKSGKNGYFQNGFGNNFLGAFIYNFLKTFCVL
jgi:hypothetical protein